MSEMSAIIQPALEAVTAFSATNVDDLFLLMLCFSRLDSYFRAWHVVCGQFLGIAALLAVSLLSPLGRLVLPEGWIGLLGLFPISLGLSQLAETFNGVHGDAKSRDLQVNHGEGWLTASVGVAALTIANGSDNISVYMAMLTNGDPLRLQVIPLVFALLTGLWCLLAWWLTQSSTLAPPLQRLQRDLAPALLVAIGLVVLNTNHILQHPLLASVTLACLGVMVGSLTRQLSLLPRPRRQTAAPQP